MTALDFTSPANITVTATFVPTIWGFVGADGFDDGSVGDDTPAGSDGDATPSRAGQTEGGFILKLAGTLETSLPVITWQESSAVVPRVLPYVRVTVPAPAIIKGKPWVPEFWLKPDSSVALTQGSGHIRMIPDPDPVVGNEPAPDPTVPAAWPKSKKPDLWYTVNDLATPPSAGVDLSTWPEHFGGPAWHSKGAYRPRLRRRVAFGPGGRQHTFTKAVHFDPNQVEHMYLDLGGSPLAQPYTILVAGIINSYPQRTYGHYIIDAGKEPPKKNTDRDWYINDGLTYRNVMLFQLHSAIICTRKVVEDGVFARSAHNYKRRPRVFIGQYNGGSSYVGYMDPKQKVLKKGRTDVNTVRYLTMGRRADYISDNLASHMTLFEVRIFRSALTKKEITAHYKQMAATWKFAKFAQGGS